MSTSNEIPKELRHLLLKRGGMALIEKELRARNRIVERPNTVFSTQQAAPIKREQDKNKGCHPASSAIANYNPLDDATSGRTRFRSECTGKLGEYRTVSYQEHKMHVKGEMRQ